MKKLLLLPLALLFAFPALAAAADTPRSAGKLPASFYCASAKQIAQGYVLLIKEKYAGMPKDQNYFNARLQYEIAAAKFAGLRSTLELEAIGGSRIPNVNDGKYQLMAAEALQAFDDFSVISRKILVYPPEYAAGQALIPPDFSAAVFDIFSFISRFQELWVKHDQIRETRLKKLDQWLEQYYQWPHWDEIGANPESAALQQ